MMKNYFVRKGSEKFIQITARDIGDVRHQILDIYGTMGHGWDGIKIDVYDGNFKKIGQVTIADASLFYWQSPRTKGKVCFYYSGELAR